METKKQKQMYNVIMVVTIILIATLGILFVGNTKGWFINAEDSFSSITSTIGHVAIEREGVSFDLKKGTPLKSGDLISTQKNGSATFIAKDNEYIIGENSSVKIDSLDNDILSLSLSSGEIFVILNSKDNHGYIAVGERKFLSDDAVFSVNVQSGSMNVYVFEGTVTFEQADGSVVTASAGEYISIVNDDIQVLDLEMGVLNDFNLENLLNVSDEHTLCFTDEEINNEIKERHAESGKTEGGTITLEGELVTDTESNEDEPGTQSEEGSTTKEKDDNDDSDDSNMTTNKFDSKTTTKKSDSTTKKSDKETTTKKTTATTNKTETTTSAKTYKCTIEIRCDNILNNLDKLDPGKAGYVPSNGIILPKTTVEFTEGETAFDILKRACNAYGIQLEYSWTPMYDSYYVEGINHLYEFDCGDQSGWMFKVNGWFPNYGCSQYEIEDGDAMVWSYTCDLGSDVGNSVY